MLHAADARLGRARSESAALYSIHGTLRAQHWNVWNGLREYVCKPTIDFVHNIWFEFHEDFLAVLGRPRDMT